MNNFPNITCEQLFLQRRQLIKSMASAGLVSALGLSSSGLSAQTVKENKITPFALASSYNNYYEFSSNKKMVKHIAKDFETSNWQISISGLVEKPLVISASDLFDLTQVQRTYKLRCVEGWSAIIPWSGVQLSTLLDLVSPLAGAKFVKFSSCLDLGQMIGQRSNNLPWPYTEGLRLDEAKHALTILATGMYDKPLTNQNGAPVRLVVPWKYGYKSIKAISKIELVATQPVSSWQKQVPSEYGFYGNVNPAISHPRWSQRREVLLGESKKIKTQLLNGYAKQVSDLYKRDNINSLI